MEAIILGVNTCFIVTKPSQKQDFYLYAKREIMPKDHNVVNVNEK